MCLTSMPHLKRTPMFQWWMVGHGYENGHQKGRCWKDIGLCAQSIFTILNAIIIVIWRDMYDHLITWRILLWQCNMVFPYIPTPKFTRKVGHKHDVDLLIISHSLCVLYSTIIWCKRRIASVLRPVSLMLFLRFILLYLMCKEDNFLEWVTFSFPTLVPVMMSPFPSRYVNNKWCNSSTPRAIVL